MVPVLNAEHLYIGDNGAVFCGGCAGSSAKYTGRDISGQKVDRMPPGATFDGTPFKCERCGLIEKLVTLR